MPLSFRASLIDYTNRQIPLKYSLCSFKIWLFYNTNYKRTNYKRINNKK